MVNRVVIEMRRNRIGFHVVRRVLHGRELVDIQASGQYDNSAGVLARRSAHVNTALRDSRNLAVPLRDAVFFKVFTHVAACGFLRNGTDGSRTERLSRTENNLGVLMRFRLILSREI